MKVDIDKRSTIVRTKKTEGVSVCLFSVAGVHWQQKHYMLLFALIIPRWLRGCPHVVTGYRYSFNVTAYIATPFRPVRRHFET